MALDIDYAGLWERARRKNVGGHLLLTFAPEDELLLLALHGGKEMWWNLKWAFDFAAFVRSHPDVDWGSVKKRAGDQGCLRMVLLATSLARRFFHVAVPDSIVAAERQDREIGPMVDRIVEHWNSNEAVFSPDNNSISLDRLRLHDGLTRRIRYAAKTMFLPGPHHVSSKWFPRRIGTMSVVVKLAHDMVAMPLWRTYRATAAQMERLPYACASSDFALGLIPASADTKATIRRFRQARAEAERRIARAATDPLAWRDLGDALSGLGRHKRAIACYDKALSFSPNNSVTWKKRAAAVRATGASQGLPNPPQDSKDARAWAILAARLFGSKRYVEASEASDRALAIEPENVAAARVGIQARLWACEWHRRDADERRITEELAAGRQIIMPFYHRVISDSEEESLIVARLAARGIFAPASPLWRGERYSHDKIRLAYSSTDFRDHVVADVMVGLFEHHDKSRFEITAISLGPDDGSATRRRVVAAFDRFVHAQTESDGGIAKLLRDLEIDIVVDLNGNSGDARPGIFGHRAVPLQVTFQGYPGTMGAPFFDYMIADAFTIPLENRQFYSEQIVNMPHTYMPNDNTRPIAERTPTRAEAGLPEEGFVFACHNHEYKISPDIFDIWMRLLKQVDGSVLWLKSVNPSAVINLRREAAAWGVAPERLIFAPRLPKAEDHLARLQLADLFLDTRPYNAHATACDALWAGLPVLTCPGRAFPARVAASVLFAIGLPELVAASLEDYEALALALAHDPQRLAAIREKLAHNRVPSRCSTRHASRAILNPPIFRCGLASNRVCRRWLLRLIDRRSMRSRRTTMLIVVTAALSADDQSGARA